jgi:hypothetical protein
MAERAMQDGSGLQKFQELVIAQHGDVSTLTTSINCLRLSLLSLYWLKKAVGNQRKR